MFNACRRGASSICRVARLAQNPVDISIRSRPSHSLRLTTSLQPSCTRYIHIAPILRTTAHAAVNTIEASESALLGQEHGPITKFHELADRGHVHPRIITAITEDMGHDTLTQVQSLTINESLKGTDMVAQARTGTGKTIGFLLPVIQSILRNDPELAERKFRRGSRASASDIRAIIMSPTRELAEQIAVEARKLTKTTGIVVQTAVGGSAKRLALLNMKREGCHLLVATPGRLYDLLTDQYSGVRAPKLQSLVLDEADRLLDIGFADDIRKIIDQFPQRSEVDRQTLLFSATMPDDVMALVEETLKEDFQFVQTVHEGEQQTHERVPQKLIETRGYENLMPALLQLCKRGISEATSERPFKAIVFFSSTANVELAEAIFQKLRSEDGLRQHPLHPTKIIGMHGKLTQGERTRASEAFRRLKSAIMFSSDVTARGMDFPGVTHVIQVGLPPNAEQYVHRVGRTGRGSNSGEGYIIIPSVELNPARKMLGQFPITKDSSLNAAAVDMTKDAQLSSEVATILNEVGNSTKEVDSYIKGAAYKASLGMTQQRGGTMQQKQQTVNLLNQWCRYGWGWEVPPVVQPSWVAKMGFSHLNGLNIGHEIERRPRDDFDNRRGFGDNRGGRSGFDRSRSLVGRRGFDRARSGGRGGNDWTDASGRSRRASF